MILLRADDSAVACGMNFKQEYILLEVPSWNYYLILIRYEPKVMI